MTTTTPVTGTYGGFPSYDDYIRSIDDVQKLQNECRAWKSLFGESLARREALQGEIDSMQARLESLQAELGKALNKLTLVNEALAS